MKYNLQTVVVGSYEENCYILTIDDDTYLIDPGDEERKIDEFLKNKNLKAILVTHHHFDHVGALEYFEKKYNLKHNDFDDNRYEVIKNPGHTSDSISFYFKDLGIIFCGDFIFKRSIGRMDLPTGSEIEMKKSLEMISRYDDDIILYPGHGINTTLGYEISNNPYFGEYL